MKSTILIIILLALVMYTRAQNLNKIHLNHLKENKRGFIDVPNINGYVTLKGDFHMHTIFSDGDVWPTVRVEEAWQEGLDVIAITDHIEFAPKSRWVKGDRNASYNIAKRRARKRDILLVRGGEITKIFSSGHLNALFVKNVNKIKQRSALQAVEAAHKQGGLVIWNHPGWSIPQRDSVKWHQVHTTMLENGWLHGIEVFNDDTYYPIATEWCKDKKLACFASSDIHQVVSHHFNLEESHRPMTLIFAEERTLASLKEAMLSERTVAWFDDQLAGPEHILNALFEESIEINTDYDEELDNFSVHIQNRSDLTFLLVADDPKKEIPDTIKLLDQSTVQFRTPRSTSNTHKYNVENCHSGMKSTLQVELEIIDEKTRKSTPAYIVDHHLTNRNIIKCVQ